MKLTHKRSLFVTMIACGISSSALAQEINSEMGEGANRQASEIIAATSDDSEKRSLLETLGFALANNSELAAAKSQYLAVHRQQFVSLSTMLPQVSAFARYNYHKIGEQDPGFDYDEYDDDAFGLSISYDVFTSGKNLNAYRSARADVRKQNQDRLAVEQNVLLDAITSHFDVVRDEAVYQLNEKNVDILSQQLQAVKDRFEVGVVTRTDVAQSQARLAAARSELIAAQTSLQASRAFYERTIGVPPESLAEQASLPSLPETIDDALDVGRSRNPLLNAARENARSSALSAYSAIGAAMPQLRVAGTYTRYDDQTPNPAIGKLEEGEIYELSATVTVPLFTGGRNLATVLAARHASDALTKSVHATASSVDEAIVVAWHRNLAAGAVIGAREEQIKASQIALEGVRLENSLGTRTTLDVLDAEQDYLDARVNLIRAQRDQFVSAYGLLASLGELTGVLFVAEND